MQTGKIYKKGFLKATRAALTEWRADIGHPWICAMEATIFTGWIYDFPKHHAEQMKVVVFSSTHFDLIRQFFNICSPITKESIAIFYDGLGQHK